MKFLSFLLATVVILGSCTPDESPMPVPPLTDTFNYLALGDSYTIGQSVEYDERWPVQLVNRLQTEDINMLSPQIIATTGWRTDDLSSGIANSSINTSYDLVSLLIGVNNQFQGGSIETYESEFEALLAKAIELADGQKDRVFVLSIPDYAYTPYGQSATNTEAISVELDEFNAINRSITESQGIAYFDITPISREGNDRTELVALDGLHPSGQQYSEWVDLIYSDVKALIQN